VGKNRSSLHTSVLSFPQVVCLHASCMARYDPALRDQSAAYIRAQVMYMCFGNFVVQAPIVWHALFLRAL